MEWWLCVKGQTAHMSGLARFPRLNGALGHPPLFPTISAIGEPIGSRINDKRNRVSPITSYDVLEVRTTEVVH